MVVNVLVAFVHGVVSELELVGSLKHEGHRPFSYLYGLQVGIRGLNEDVTLWSVASHSLMQTGAPGSEASFLRIIDSSYVSHELCHGISVVVRRTEGVLSY